MNRRRQESDFSNLTFNSAWLEIRIFYVRISPCMGDSLSESLILHHRREISTPLEINGSRIPATDSASVTLRHANVIKDGCEVAYVSTDSIRTIGAVEFEVSDRNAILLCGSLEREELEWGNSTGGQENGSGTGWSMECYMAASILDGKSSFFQPQMGASSPVIEVYIAGCCGGVPVILTKMILTGPRKKGLRHGILDAIPENEELGKKQNGFGSCNAFVSHHKVPQMVSSSFNSRADSEEDDYELEIKSEKKRDYLEELNSGEEDGQLSWFNAGVRVGVGIGLGMSLGIGIGVGLLMRSCHTTTRKFRGFF